jgi:hypothetical protein
MIHPLPAARIREIEAVLAMIMPSILEASLSASIRFEINDAHDKAHDAKQEEDRKIRARCDERQIVPYEWRDADTSQYSDPGERLDIADLPRPPLNNEVTKTPCKHCGNRRKNIDAQHRVIIHQHPPTPSH